MPTLLAIIPHPDDESYSFAGTIALAARAGWRCLLYCATNGEAGERHDGGPRRKAVLGADRFAELAASCALLGAEPPSAWALPDGALDARPPESTRIRHLFRELQPALVLTLGADGAYGHPDHLAVHRWIAAAWHGLSGERPALLYAAFPKGLMLPQYEKCVASGVMGRPPHLRSSDIGRADPHYRVPLAAVSDLKLASIAAHRTQLPGGDPHALFPRGIVAALLEEERFTDASAAPEPATERLLGQFAAAAEQSAPPRR
ncbi:MAG: PIG-L deacetylase family protein [Tepidiformaceae bacterium]